MCLFPYATRRIQYTCRHHLPSLFIKLSANVKTQKQLATSGAHFLNQTNERSVVAFCRIGEAKCCGGRRCQRWESRKRISKTTNEALQFPSLAFTDRFFLWLQEGMQVEREFFGARRKESRMSSSSVSIHSSSVYCC